MQFSSRARWLGVAILGLAGLVGFSELRRDEVAAPARVPPAIERRHASLPRSHTGKSMVPYDEAKPILAKYANDLPLELSGKGGTEISEVWSGWTLRHDVAVRSRILRGEEDSIVNFWLYGTSFTDAPRVTARGRVQFSFRLE